MPWAYIIIFDVQQNYGNPPGRSELTAATNGQWTMASNRGPNAVGAAPQFAHSAASAGGASGAGAGSTSGIAAANRGVGGSWGAGGAAPSASGMGVGVGGAGGGMAAPVAAPPAAPAMGTGTAGASASDGSYERNLVMELCPPGGMKAEPPLEKLVAFLRAIPSLDADLVCPVLLDCLEDGQPWIIKAKALCVIEKTIVTAEEQGLDAYSAFFHACAEEIQPLAVHNRSAIHNPARRVLKALGLDAAYSTAGGAAPPVRAQKAAAAAPVVAEAPNLLDFDEPTAAPAPAPAPVSAAPVPDMLGGDDVPAAAPAPAAPTPAPAAAGGDMFGGLTTKDKAVPAPAAAAPAPPVANGGGDLFGDMQVKPSISTETPVGNGTAAPAAAAPASGGSAFGFMNATANGSAPAPAPAAPAPAAAAPAPTPAAPAASPKPGDAGFDPLLSLSAPSEPTAEEKVAKTQAQIAQMQAMQYQQQMMMMQQQMAQMQMAMAGGGVPQSPRPATHAAAGSSAGVNANVMSAHNSTATTGFSFLDNASSAAQEAQKKKNAAFNFVMDDMKKG